MSLVFILVTCPFEPHHWHDQWQTRLQCQALFEGLILWHEISAVYGKVGQEPIKCNLKTMPQRIPKTNAWTNILRTFIQLTLGGCLFKAGVERIWLESAWQTKWTVFYCGDYSHTRDWLLLVSNFLFSYIVLKDRKSFHCFEFKSELRFIWDRGSRCFLWSFTLLYYVRGD